MPARIVYTLATGKSVSLKVQPVDPYNILSGYYVVLGFEINRTAAFPNQADFEQSKTCYAVIERSQDGTWKPITLEHELPKNLPENRVALFGRIYYGSIEYGIEHFYIPETSRGVIEDDLRRNRDKAYVEIKVDRSGNAALERLRIEDRVYESK
jgi:uncharacterized membrane-anchored protein